MQFMRSANLVSVEDVHTRARGEVIGLRQGRQTRFLCIATSAFANNCIRYRSWPLDSHAHKFALWWARTPITRISGVVKRPKRNIGINQYQDILAVGYNVHNLD